MNVAHRFGVSVEGELGCLGSLESGSGEKEDGHGAEGKLSLDQLLTDPDQAVDFVKRTGIDALAVAMGTSHGAYKFSRKPTGDVLAMDRIEQIHKNIPNCHLVMHGSSSVPEDLVGIINKYNGKIKETYGVPVGEIQRGIRAGVRKINVDTDNRLAITGAIRKAFVEKPEEFDPRYYLTPARAAMQKVCEERMKQFGQAGQAPNVPLVTLEQMAKDYESGKFGVERQAGRPVHRAQRQRRRRQRDGALTRAARGERSGRPGLLGSGRYLVSRPSSETAAHAIMELSRMSCSAVSRSAEAGAWARMTAANCLAPAWMAS